MIPTFLGGTYAATRLFSLKFESWVDRIRTVIIVKLFISQDSCQRSVQEVVKANYELADRSNAPKSSKRKFNKTTLSKLSSKTGKKSSPWERQLKVDPGNQWLG